MCSAISYRGDLKIGRRGARPWHRHVSPVSPRSLANWWPPPRRLMAAIKLIIHLSDIATSNNISMCIYWCISMACVTFSLYWYWFIRAYKYWCLFLANLDFGVLVSLSVDFPVGFFDFFALASFFFFPLSLSLLMRQEWWAILPVVLFLFSFARHGNKSIVQNVIYYNGNQNVYHLRAHSSLTVVTYYNECCCLIVSPSRWKSGSALDSYHAGANWISFPRE